MNWLALLPLILQLAAYIARQAERRDIEKALLNELASLHKKRVDRAADARDRALSGELPEDDKYQRD